MDEELYNNWIKIGMELYELCNTMGKAILRRASEIDPTTFFKRVAFRGEFDRIEDDLIVYELLESDGDITDSKVPVSWLWNENWEDELVALVEKRKQEELAWVEQQEAISKEAAAERRRLMDRAEKQELNRLLSKYGVPKKFKGQ